MSWSVRNGKGELVAIFVERDLAIEYAGTKDGQHSVSKCGVMLENLLKCVPGMVEVDKIIVKAQ